MSFEENIVKIIRKILPEGSIQLNKSNESDSEILQFDNKRILVNIDTFSKEDYFNENDFYALGWNFAVGGISDILASGGIPLFYGHSLTISKDWNKNNVVNLTRGVKSILNKTGTHFIGGDLGIQNEWSYTAVVLGKPSDNLLLRSNAKIGDIIYISGKVGAGNLDAAIKIFDKYKINRFKKNKFHLRLDESKIISRYSNCCIDTSDGLFNALNTISDQSKVGYEIENVPYIETGIAASKIFSVPHELLFFGECGEYELLFTISKGKESDFLKDTKKRNLKFCRIGTIKEKDVRILKSEKKIIKLKNINKRARDFDTIREYLKYLKNHIND